MYVWNPEIETEPRNGVESSECEIYIHTYTHVVLSVFIVCNPQQKMHVKMLILGLIVRRVGQCSCLQQMSYEDIHYLWMISFCQLMER